MPALPTADRSPDPGGAAGGAGRAAPRPGPEPAGAAPSITLGALLTERALGLRLLSGSPDTELLGVHASEMADPSPYLLGGELLLTAGAGLAAAGPAEPGTSREASSRASDTPAEPVPWRGTGCPGGTDRGGDGDDGGRDDNGHGSGDLDGSGRGGPSGAGGGDAGPGGSGHAPRGHGAGDADAYVVRLVRAGVAALGFGVAPVHARVPEELLAACARHGLPLLEVPQPTPFTAVARAVWRLMAEARTRELRRVAEAQQSLAAAASRPDPVQAVLRRLAAVLGGWTAVLAPDGTVTAAAGPTPPQHAVDALAGLARRVASGGPATATDTLPPAVPPAGATATPAGAVAVAGAASGASPDAGTGPGEAPDRGPAGAGPGSARTGPAGTDPAQAVPQHLTAYALGPQAGSTGLRAVLAVASPVRTPGDHTVAGAAAVLLTLLTTARQGHGSADAGARSSAALLRLLLGRPPAEAVALLGAGPWTVVHARALPGTDAAQSPGAAAALAAELGAALVDAEGPAVRMLTDREPEPRPGWRLGASSPAGATDLTAADAEAAGALRRAEAARSPLLRHTADGMAALVPAAQAAAHARALLAPLDPVLRGTLRAWLTHHGGWDRAAAALGVHRNTVRQRIARCADLLGRDLDDPDVRMELWFALRHDSP